MSSKKLMLALAVLIWLTLHPQGTQADPCKRFRGGKSTPAIDKRSSPCVIFAQ